MKRIALALLTLLAVILLAGAQGTNITISADGTFQVPTNTMSLLTNWQWFALAPEARVTPPGLPRVAVALRIVSRAGNFAIGPQTNFVTALAVTNAVLLMQFKDTGVTNYYAWNGTNINPWTNAIPANAP